MAPVGAVVGLLPGPAPGVTPVAQPARATVNVTAPAAAVQILVVRAFIAVLPLDAEIFSAAH
jgi:hypothetical protein